MSGGTLAAPPCPVATPAGTIQAEVAATPAERQRGLMGRTTLPDQAGMLFVFERQGRHCFWMQDTWLPLVVAFIDDAGRITQTETMAPSTTTLHCANAPVRFALEVTPASFAAHGLLPGARVDVTRCSSAAR